MHGIGTRSLICCRSGRHLDGILGDKNCAIQHDSWRMASYKEDPSYKLGDEQRESYFMHGIGARNLKCCSSGRRQDGILGDKNCEIQLDSWRTASYKEDPSYKLDFSSHCR